MVVVPLDAYVALGAVHGVRRLVDAVRAGGGGGRRATIAKRGDMKETEKIARTCSCRLGLGRCTRPHPQPATVYRKSFSPAEVAEPPPPTRGNARRRQAGVAVPPPPPPSRVQPASPDHARIHARDREQRCHRDGVKEEARQRREWPDERRFRRVIRRRAGKQDEAADGSEP